MRFAKLLGLVVVTAAVLTALAGAGSASAWSLCKKKEAPCAEKNLYHVGQVIAGEGELNSFGFSGSMEFFCEFSNLGDTLTSEAGIPLFGTISAPSWSGCNGSTSAAHLPWTTELFETEKGRWRLDITSSGAGNPGFTTGGICTYTAATISLAVEGSLLTSGPAKFYAEAEPLSGPCGETQWSATFLSPSLFYSG
jgi:hypothetical protein